MYTDTKYIYNRNMGYNNSGFLCLNSSWASNEPALYDDQNTAKPWIIRVIITNYHDDNRSLLPSLRMTTMENFLIRK